MKAIHPENQAALDRFCKNDFWRHYYEDAPSVAKELIEGSFRYSVEGSEDKSNISEQKKRADEREARMTEDDLRYLADVGCHPLMRKHYREVLEKRRDAAVRAEGEFLRRAREWYCRRRTWSSRYRVASPCVKKYFDLAFALGYGESVEAERETFERLKPKLDAQLVGLYCLFTDKEWNEAIAVSGARMGLALARNKYQKKSI